MMQSSHICNSNNEVGRTLELLRLYRRPPAGAGGVGVDCPFRAIVIYTFSIGVVFESRSPSYDFDQARSNDGQCQHIRGP